MWEVKNCEACGEMIEWIWEGDRRLAYNFVGLGLLGPLHMSTCHNPDYFSAKKKKKKKTKKLTEYEQKLRDEPWWNK